MEKPLWLLQARLFSHSKLLCAVNVEGQEHFGFSLVSRINCCPQDGISTNVVLNNLASGMLLAGHSSLQVPNLDQSSCDIIEQEIGLDLSYLQESSLALKNTTSPLEM